MQFGEFLLDLNAGKLFRFDQEVSLEPQCYALLALFVSRKQQIVSREEILNCVWGDRHVSDDAIRAAIKKLRIALGDDARSPTFIKTIPLKGYQFIAQVKDVKQADGNTRNRYFVVVVLFIVILISLLLTGLNKLNSKNDLKDASSHIEKLTSMAGSEVSPDYSPSKHALVFSHRNNNVDALNLYIKDLANQKTHRLTWDNASYANAMWSPDGSKIVFTRSDKSGTQHYVAEIDSENNLLTSQAIVDDVLRGYYVVGWARDGKSLYLKNAYRNLSLQGIARYDLESNVMAQVTLPNGTGVGDYFAKESPDGARLAILRSVESNKHELLILDIKSGTLLHNLVLPTPVSRLAWQPNNSGLVLTGFKGEIFAYDMRTDTLSKKELNLDFINDIFYACGPGCYFLRQHNGNFLDIQEQPNPFNQVDFTAGLHLDLSSSEDFPLYSQRNNSIYFLSLGANTISLKKHHANGVIDVLTEFPKNANIASLSINVQGTHLLGHVDKRIFIFDVEEKALTYITSDLESVSHPTWHPNGTSIYFAHFTDNKVKVVKRELETSQQHTQIESYIAVQHTPEHIVGITAELEAWQLKLIDNKLVPIKKLAKIASAQPNRWLIRGNHLYFTSRQDEFAVLKRININNGQSQQRTLAKNRFRLNFDIDSTSQKILSVESLVAQSDLVKVAKIN